MTSACVMLAGGRVALAAVWHIMSPANEFVINLFASGNCY